VHFILATRFLSAGGAQRRRRSMPTRVSSLTTPLRKSRVYIRPILTVTSRPNRTQPRVLGVVPARYSSRRFAGKPLALLRGKPLVMHVYHNACKAKCLDACVVATDDERIAKAVRDHGGEVIMTDGACETSLERCLEVVNRLLRRASKWNPEENERRLVISWTKTNQGVGDFDVVVCIDADEPFVQPHHIETAADLVINSDAVVGTLVRPGANEEVRTNTRAAVAKTKNFSPKMPKKLFT
jgi:3-deoxy-manno-octulosonate cytidylyltransferase (CMP-KDO synthetase)